MPLLSALCLVLAACSGDAGNGSGNEGAGDVADVPAQEGAVPAEGAAAGGGAGAEAAGDPPGQEVPGTDIWLGELVREGDGLRVEALQNVTQRTGYDNQPGFLRDNTAFLYTSVDETGQADIWRYELSTGRNSRVTRTAPESEYSPTPIPDARGFSAVRVEADSTQRLWRFAHDGTDGAVLFPDVEPVGYHAWAGPEYAVLFVLGEPPTLQVVEGGTNRVREIARDVGRSLQSIPGEQAVSFVQHVPAADEGPPETQVMRWSPTDGISPVTGGLEGGDDHAWTPDGMLLMGLENEIHGWRRGWEEWRVVGALPDGVEVSRMAVSPDGRRIAVVGDPGGG